MPQRPRHEQGDEADHFLQTIQSSTAIGSLVASRPAVEVPFVGLGFALQDPRVTIFRMGILYTDALAAVRSGTLDIAARRRRAQQSPAKPANPAPAGTLSHRDAHAAPEPAVYETGVSEVPGAFWGAMDRQRGVWRRRKDRAGAIGHKDDGLDRETSKVGFERLDEPDIETLCMAQIAQRITVFQGITKDAYPLFELGAGDWQTQALQASRQTDEEFRAVW